jgi:GAF domain-containing protein
MAGFAAEKMSRVRGTRIECAVTLRRRKHSTTIAGSSEKAVRLDRIEQRMGEGPCFEALETGHPVILSDAHDDQRWPNYCKVLTEEGYRSAVGIPLTLAAEAAGVLNFFAAPAGEFAPDTLGDAHVYADMAARTLRLALRIATTEQLADNLKAALESRTAIDLACGMIMAQNQCTQDEAIEILKKASSGRNQKLRTIAEEMTQRVAKSEATTYFEE